MNAGIESVLFIGAHPDDLEFMAGGTAKRVIDEGGRVHVLTITNGSWTGPDGSVFRDGGIAIAEAEAAAKAIGYSVEHMGTSDGDERVFGISYKDATVTKILDTAQRIAADTIICPWLGDVHVDHQVVARMAIAASRRIPRVLMGQGNWYVGTQTFNPNLFVDISATYEAKMSALECYSSEMARTGSVWLSYHDALTRYYGLIAGVERAEGFVSAKFAI